MSEFEVVGRPSARTHDDAISASEIARLAGVGPSAVGNWRRRFSDGTDSFPSPLDTPGPHGGPLFSRRQVEEWLAGREDPTRKPKRGRSPAPNTDRAASLWQDFDTLRGRDRFDRGPLHDRSRATEEGHEEKERAEKTALSLLVLMKARPSLLGRLESAPDEARKNVRNETRNADLAHPRVANLLGDLASSEEAVGEIAPAIARLVGEVNLERTFEGVLKRRRQGPSFAALSSPQALARFLVRIADPHGLVLDPAAGDGGFLLEAARRYTEKRGVPRLRLVGIEREAEAVRVARQRFFVHGIEVELREGDGLAAHSVHERAHVVLCDPPFGAKPPSPRRARGAHTAGGFDWLEAAASWLASTGRAYVLLPASSLFRGGGDALRRQELLRVGAVEAIIALPGGLTQDTSVPLALWVLRPPASQGAASVLLVDAAGDAPRRRRAAPPDPEPIAQILGDFRANPEAFTPRSDAVAVRVLDLLVPDATLVPANWLQRAKRSINDDMDLVREALAEMRAGEDLLNLPFPLVARRSSKLSKLEDEGRIRLIRGVRVGGAAVKAPGEADEYLLPVLRSPWDHSIDERWVDPKRLPSDERPTSRRGDVIVMHEGGRPCAFVCDRDADLLPWEMHAVRIVDERIDPRALAALLSAPKNARFSGGGSTIPRARLAAFEIPALEDEEWQRLGEYVGRIDEHIARARALPDKLAAFRSVLADAVSDGLRSGQGPGQ